MPAPAPTLRSLAKLLGLSRTTVSDTLRAYPPWPESPGSWQSMGGPQSMGMLNLIAGRDQADKEIPVSR